MASVYPSTRDSFSSSSTIYIYGVTLKLTLTVGCLFSGSQYNYSPSVKITASGTTTAAFSFSYSVSGAAGSTSGSKSWSKGSSFSDYTVATAAGPTQYAQPNGSSLSRSVTSTFTTNLSGETRSTSATVSLTFADLKRTYTFSPNGANGTTETKSGLYGQSSTAPTNRAKNSGTGTGSSTVTLNPNNGEGPTYQSVTWNETITYSFSGWSRNANGSGGWLNPGASFTFGGDTPSEGNKTYYAQFNAHSTRDGGNRVSLYMPNYEGHTFLGWYDGDTNEGMSGESVDIYKYDATLEGRWSANDYPYTVWYKAPDGSELFPPSSGVASYGSTKSFSAPSKNGYAPDASSKSMKIGLSGNEITFNYSYVANKIKYEVGQYGTLVDPLTSYTIQSDWRVDPATLKHYILISTPQIKVGYEQWSFTGWTGGGIISPQVEVPIYLENTIFNGSTTTYTAHYERVSKKWKGAGGNWRPIMNTYVKAKDGKWHLVPKGKSFVKTQQGWRQEAQAD